MRPSLAVLTLAAFLSLGLSPARADGPSLSLSLERAAGLSLVSDGRDTASQVAIGGPSALVVAYPLVAVDYLAPGGLTLGGGFAYTRLKLDEYTVTRVSVEPRIGVRIVLGPRFELVPRAALALGNTNSGSERSSVSSDTTSVHGSLSLVGVWRLGAHFNLLTAAAVERQLDDPDRVDGVGRNVNSVQLWFGFGGYL